MRLRFSYFPAAKAYNHDRMGFLFFGVDVAYGEQNNETAQNLFDVSRGENGVYSFTGPDRRPFNYRMNDLFRFDDGINYTGSDRKIEDIAENLSMDIASGKNVTIVVEGGPSRVGRSTVAFHPSMLMGDLLTEIERVSLRPEEGSMAAVSWAQIRAYALKDTRQGLVCPLVTRLDFQENAKFVPPLRRFRRPKTTFQQAMDNMSFIDHPVGIPLSTTFLRLSDYISRFSSTRDVSASVVELRVMVRRSNDQEPGWSGLLTVIDMPSPTKDSDMLTTDVVKWVHWLADARPGVPSPLRSTLLRAMVQSPDTLVVLGLLPLRVRNGCRDQEATLRAEARRTASHLDGFYRYCSVKERQRAKAQIQAPVAPSVEPEEPEEPQPPAGPGSVLLALNDLVLFVKQARAYATQRVQEAYISTMGQAMMEPAADPVDGDSFQGQPPPDLADHCRESSNPPRTVDATDTGTSLRPGTSHQS